ncbi:MAG: four helix bundle protein [Bacteroidota bacterium]
MHNYKKLVVWQMAVDLSVRIYKLTGSFPSDEKFGIISQVRRAAVSIPSNIAEGSARNSRKMFSSFLEISLGSSFELETQLIISRQIGYITEGSFNELNDEINKIQKMIQALRQRQIKGGSNLPED